MFNTDDRRPNDHWSVFELRQYTLHPGQRDVLIELFDREFVETQEAVGMRVVGQFRDQEDDDRFVWVRGFRDMTSRTEALAAFYGGPVWKEHKDKANATMIDSDDVLLLRPVSVESGFPTANRARPPAATDTPPPESIVTATICYRDAPVDETFLDFFADRVQPVLLEARARPIACLQTESAQNTYPALPVRTDDQVFIWFSSFATAELYREHTDRLSKSPVWQQTVLPELLAHLVCPPRQLRLMPTARSLLC